MGEAIWIERERERCTDALAAEFHSLMTGVSGTFERREAVANTIFKRSGQRWFESGARRARHCERSTSANGCRRSFESRRAERAR